MDESNTEFEDATSRLQTSEAAAEEPDLALDKMTVSETAVSIESSENSDYESLQSIGQNNEQLMQSAEWLGKKKHVFILSEAGKPVYSRLVVLTIVGTW